MEVFVLEIYRDKPVVLIFLSPRASGLLPRSLLRNNNSPQIRFTLRKLWLSVVVYQGPNQTNQDLIKAWLKHEEPNFTTGRTRQKQEVVNQIPSSSPSEYSQNTERLATFPSQHLYVGPIWV